jgi:K+-sensing histidine kinase KdpD
MRRYSLQITTETLRNTFFAFIIVLATTFFLLLIGRNEVGEGVIALVYLVPVIWSGYQWGQGPGLSAALAAALMFDFFFIPPFYTFTIGSLEGWLVLAIFLAVAMFLVGRLHANFTRAREATFMYELSAALANTLTEEAVAHAAAKYIQRLFQASLVNVMYQPTKQTPKVVISEPYTGTGEGHPDRLLPLFNSWGLVGEIQIWRGSYVALPSEDSQLFQNFTKQTAKAFERASLIEAQIGTTPSGKSSIKSRG